MATEWGGGSAADVEVWFQVTPIVSYAMVHNRLPVVQRLEIGSRIDAQGAVLTLSVRDDEGVVSLEFSQPVDLIAGELVSLIRPDLRLDPAALLQNRERRPAWITARVTSHDQPVAEHTEEVSLLAGSQWLSQPPGVAFELLSAFVMPNDPAIGRLIADAAPILAAATGSSGIDGYQSGSPDRVDEIVDAIWSAAQRLNISYAVAPASWADVGQKVRTPADVLDGGVGTCLDTTVVLAAALEQAGLHPLVIVTEGHAFLGYWRVETTLDAIVYGDVREILNFIDLGHIGIVETTLVTRRDQPESLRAARAAAAKHLADPDTVLAIVDVRQARLGGIVPLPVKRVSDDGTVQIVGYAPTAAGDRTVVVTPQARPEEVTRVSDVPPRVQQWKNKLLDLSLRNRLINYSDRAGVRIRVPAGRLGTLEDLVSARKPLVLRPADHIEEIDRARGIDQAANLPDDRLASQLIDRNAVYTDVMSGGYQTRMRGLAYKARTIAEETGANNLYLAMGSLSWSIDGRQLRSPLILVPVRLTTVARGSTYRLQLDETGGSTPNYCLLEKLRQLHGLTIPGLNEPADDDSGIDLDAALRAARVALASKGLPYQVQETADLSILQFAKFRLWKDLDEHWPSLVANPLVRHLVETPTDPYDDPIAPPDAIDLDELDALCPTPADASQLDAVAAAVHGNTFVLEGPPGTGKSQTITNLLTRAVAGGKRVLFVAEKRAALDVVAERLDAVGMGPFALDLHDKGSKPATVRAQIKTAMDHSVVVDDQGVAANHEDLRSTRRVLARYAQRLHDRNAAGYSYYSARTALLALGPDQDTFELPPTLVTDETALHRGRDALRLLPDVASVAHPAPDHPWRFVPLQEIDDARVARIRAAAQAVDQAVQRLAPGELAAAVAAARTPDELGVLADLSLAPVSLAVIDAARTAAWRSSAAALDNAVAAFNSGDHAGLAFVTPAALDLPLAQIHAEATAAEASGFFGKKGRRKAVLAKLAPALKPGAAIPLKGIAPVTAGLAELRSRVDQLAAQAAALPGLAVPADWNPLTEEGRETVRTTTGRIERLAAVTDPTHGGDFVSALRAWLATSPPSDPDRARSLSAIADAFRELAQASGASAPDFERWLGGAGLLAAWIAASPRRQLDEPGLLQLRRWVALTAALAPLRALRLDHVADILAVGAVDADEAVRAFDRGVAAASIVERRGAGGFDGFDPTAHDRSVRRFSTALRHGRHLATTVAPAAVLAARPFQPSSGRGRIGALQRELAKKRGGLGVRSLLKTYGDLITQLMPCVLVSPDSVARFFPVGSVQFDMVVFDEASQIRVSDAIGAMGRGASVVIVGDSKQMPPTSFAEPATADLDDAPALDPTAIEDEESILTEAVLARVPQRWLTWHYRSQDESLIAFSNVQYYGNKLSSFPAPPRGPDQPDGDRGISLVRVDGRFLRGEKGKLLRTNPVEAQTIFEEIRRRFTASPDHAPSLGVVTFNIQQRTYIEGLIRDSGDERMIESLDAPGGEGLFVKNLENVQGDERDVIFFSTAFSVNDKGVLPLNFGPLTRAGGERRLNVAITRARRQVIIFTSFDPNQIRVDETQSVGIAHLRAYMELAAEGADTLVRTGQRRSVADRHRDEIAERLREAGLAVTTDVGLSDFRVDLVLAPGEAPDDSMVAVLLDGPGWAARRTVDDRDALPVDVLGTLMRWPAVERVWLPTWLSQPDAVTAQLIEATARAHAALAAPHPPRPTAPLLPPPTGRPIAPTLIQTGPETSTATPPPPPPSPSVQESRPAVPATPTHTSRLEGEEPFLPFRPRFRGSRDVLDRLPASSAANIVRQVIAEVIDAEGPVHVERLARLVANCFDLSRLNQARIDSIVSAIPSVRRDRDEPFAWPPTIGPDDWTSFRADPTAERPLEHISLREIGNAMVALCRNGAGMATGELSTETLVVFGSKRRTPGVQARLDSALNMAVRRGRLRHVDGLYEAT